MQKTLNAHFGAIMRTGIRESVWFRSAPKEFQKTAKIRILGIEERSYTSIMGGMPTGSNLRPALIAECDVGGEVQKFSLLLNNTDRVEAIDR